MGHSSQEGFFSPGQELLLDFAAWVDLASTANNMITGADLREGYRGCAPLPEKTYGFLIQLVFCKKIVSGLLVLVAPLLSGAPLLKKILDPPLDYSQLSTAFKVLEHTVYFASLKHADDLRV